MKLLTVRINEKFECVLNLEKQDETSRRTFVIESGIGNEAFPLFRLPLDRRSRNDSNGFPDLTIQTGSKETQFTLYKKGKEIVPSPSKTDFKYILHYYLLGDKDSADRDWRLQMKQRQRILKTGDRRLGLVDGRVCMNLAADKTYEIEVRFHLTMIPKRDDEQDLVSSFRLLASPAKWIEIVTLDFGSEASQLLVYNRDVAHVSPKQILPLFKKTKEKLVPSPPSGEKDSDYVQYDPDSHLFRSHFMAKKEMKGPFDPACDPADDKLKVLFKSTEISSLQDEYVSLPNVKIAQTGASNPTVVVDDGSGKKRTWDAIEFSDNYFYRRVFNSFLYRALEEVEEVGKEKKHKLLIKLNVLMPNVYGQRDLSAHLKYIVQDLDTILSSQYGQIIGVEVVSISESDASLLGAMFSLSRKEDWNVGRYLILDAGKGTLDFSVLEYKASRLTTKPPFTCVYRSGFVGAGNTLTYALFLDILKETIQPYMKADDVLETKMEEWLVKYLDEGDEADWVDLMTSVEKYKVELGRMVNPVSDSDDSAEYGLEDIDLSQLKSGLDKWIENNSKLTQTGYLDAMVRNLVAYTIDEIGYKGPLNYVIFAGRGFLFEPFRSAMLERIKSVPKWNGIEVKSLNSAGSSYTIKNMCLFASEMIAKGFYDGRRVGRPEVFKDSSKEPDQSQSPDSPSTGFRGWFKRLFKKGLRIYVKAQEGAFTDFDKSGDNKKMEFDDYVHGRKLFIADTNSKVTISGASHYLPAWVRKGYIDVFFDGEEFVFRQKRRSDHFDSTPAPQDRFIAESTFPYTKLDRIPFPH